MDKIDNHYENLTRFTEIINSYIEKDLSESDTRSKVLDFVIKNILGWEEQDIIREGFVREGFFDYEIRTATFAFIVEAKKTAVKLDLPTKGSQTKLKTIYSSNKTVIDQIRAYIFERGLQYGVITNGEQFIIANFVSHTGGDWRENTCLFFRELQDIKDNFIKFHNLLSKESVTRHGRIKIDTEEIKGKSLSRNKDLSYYGEKLNRNRISHQLIPILSRFFEEIFKTDSLDNDMLSKCYVENEDIKKFSSELSSIFIDQPPKFDERIAPVQNTKNTQKQIKADIFMDEYTPDPVILIGTAGAGKTSFIRNFVQNAISEKERKRRPIIYLDFRKFTKQNIYDTKFIYQQIIDLVKLECEDLKLHKLSVLKTMYSLEIKERKENSWYHLVSKNNTEEIDRLISQYLEGEIGEPIKYLKKISTYLIKQCSRKLCIIFDNVDQLKEEEQREIFLLAQSIKSNLNCIVISTLREGYFYRWKDKSPFNAYHSTIYHITAPPYREVLERRINYVLENFQFEKVEIIVGNKSVDFKEGSLRTLFENLRKALFEERNSEILSFLEETSYPNIRDGLEKFQTFLLSGHTHITEYMAFDYGRGNKKGIPFWEFIKSVMLDSNYYYNSRESKIMNLFLPSSQNTNHFTKIRLLLYLRHEVLNSGKDLMFLPVTKIITDFVKTGYSKEVILEELNELHLRNLIMTSDYSSDIEEDISIEEISKIAISTIGNYYVVSLIKQTAYIELCAVETPIYDETKFERLFYVFPESDKYGKRDLSKRTETTKVFLDYLYSMERLDLRRAIDDNENPGLSYKIIDSINNKVETQFERINKYLATD